MIASFLGGVEHSLDDKQFSGLADRLAGWSGSDIQVRLPEIQRVGLEAPEPQYVGAPVPSKSPRCQEVRSIASCRELSRRSTRASLPVR